MTTGRERELAAGCSRRYRARRRGEDVPRRRPGPEGRDAVVRTTQQRLDAATETVRRVEALRDALARGGAYDRVAAAAIDNALEGRDTRLGHGPWPTDSMARETLAAAEPPDAHAPPDRHRRHERGNRGPEPGSGDFREFGDRL